MLTKNQLINNNRLKKFSRRFTRILKKHPHLSGTIIRVRIATPKKPNSARRPVAKITLSNFSSTVAHIPGIGHNLRKHSKVLINGRGARDLPGVNTSCVRGVYDFAGVLNKKYRRSIYGVKKSQDQKNFIRRKFRIKN